MRQFRNRLNDCLSDVRQRYSDFLVIPEGHQILLNREFMVNHHMAHESQQANINIISLNTKFLDLNEQLYLDEIIPHEVAHVICRVNPEELFSKNDHCENWKELCIAMGGTGDVYIEDDLVVCP